MSASTKNVITVMILFALVMSTFGVGFVPQRTHAFGITTVEVGPLQAADTAASVTLVKKETILDAIAFALINAIIAAFSQSIIDWINSGFEGGPGFVTNLRGFLNEVADEVALDFIEGTELGFLCSPFELEVRLALAVQRSPFDRHIRCSLGDVVDNVDGFLAGDFSQGGWPAWFKVYGDIQNTPYGGYVIAESELGIRIASRRGEEVRLLTFGAGFFSKEECRTVNGEEVCSIVTPGRQIQNTVERALGIGTDRLIIADEIDEIINALIVYVAREALTGVSGLTGLSSRSSSSSQSFTNQIGQQTQGSFVEAVVAETQQAAVVASRNGLLTQIEQSIDAEESYNNTVHNTQILLGNATPEVQTCFLETLIEGQAAGFVVENNISDTAGLVAYYDEEAAASNSAISTLENLRDDVAQAQNIGQVNTINALYESLVTSNDVRGIVELGEQEAAHQTLVTINANPDRSCIEFTANGQTL